MQTQAQDLEAAQQQAAQASARALQVDRDLQEARRQTAVLAEDDQELRDKVPFEHCKTIFASFLSDTTWMCQSGIVRHSRQCQTRAHAGVSWCTPSGILHQQSSSSTPNM